MTETNHTERDGLLTTLLLLPKPNLTWEQEVVLPVEDPQPVNNNNPLRHKPTLDPKLDKEVNPPTLDTTLDLAVLNKHNKTPNKTHKTNKPIKFPQ